MAEPFQDVTRVRMTLGEETIDFDATIRQEHADENEVTEHPVEDGADPTDHIRKKPVTITLECIQSSTPLHLAAPAAVRDQQDKITGGGWAPGLTGRVRGTYATLLKAMEQGVLAELITSLRSYKSLAITSLRVTRESSSGDALTFTMTLKEVRVVSTKYDPPTVETRGKKKKDLGKKGTTPTPPAQEKTVLKAGLNWVGRQFQ